MCLLSARVSVIVCCHSPSAQLISILTGRHSLTALLLLTDDTKHRTQSGEEECAGNRFEQTEPRMGASLEECRSQPARDPSQSRLSLVSDFYGHVH